MTHQDPQGPRAHTDFLARSWFAWRSSDPRREHPRNTYMHNGDYPTVESVLHAMISWSDQARQGPLRAADAELGRIELNDADIPALVAFLAALGERVVPGHPIPELPRPAVGGRYPRNYPRD